jgi:hypothetical protein
MDRGGKLPFLIQDWKCDVNRALAVHLTLSEMPRSPRPMTAFRKTG